MSQTSPELEEVASEHSEAESPNNKRRMSSDPAMESLGESQQSNASVDQEFGCGICLDVYTTPYTIIPCLHTFDKSCLIQWWKRNPICPTCKKPSTSAKAAFQLKAIMDHVHKNRHKRRKLSQAENTNADEIYPNSNPSYDSDDSDESDDEDEDEDEEFNAPAVQETGDGLVWPCISCVPGNPTRYTCPRPLSVPTSEEILRAETLHPSLAPIRPPSRGQRRTPLTLDIQNGLPGASDHSLCVGCGTYVPLGFPGAVKCGGCGDVYCHNLDPLNCPSGARFSPRNGVELSPHTMSSLMLYFPPLVKNNQHEITRFINYTTARGLSLSDVLVALFEAKRDQTAEDTSENSADERWGMNAWFCAHCVNFVAASMIFGWWMKERQGSIERDDGLIPSRPDCWYGHECRTQTHNDSHAERMNHICENTRR